MTLSVIRLKKAGKIKYGISVVTLDYFFSSSKSCRAFTLTLVDFWRLLWVVVSCCDLFCGDCFGSFGIIVGFIWIFVVVLGCCRDFFFYCCGPLWMIVDFFYHCGKLWIVAGRIESLRVSLCFSKSLPTVLLIHHWWLLHPRFFITQSYADTSFWQFSWPF